MCEKFRNKNIIGESTSRNEIVLRKKLQCEVNIFNGATENGKKSILELKNESLKSKNEQL